MRLLRAGGLFQICEIRGRGEIAYPEVPIARSFASGLNFMRGAAPIDGVAWSFLPSGGTFDMAGNIWPAFHDAS